MPGSNEHKGCKYDCFEESRAYSSHQRYGENSEAFRLRLHDWQEGWPLQKRLEMKRHFALATNYAADSSSKSYVVARAWCCEHAKLGCIKPDESACQLQVPPAADLSRIFDSYVCA